MMVGGGDMATGGGDMVTGGGDMVTGGIEGHGEIVTYHERTDIQCP